uniref:Uncharacterized protein n=1 Tax=Pipistrellus kuhlii TaxID=59472 RepID=A0A7J7XC41_PIPKU|nr:hypothetical protein mPipKuh1_010618 [Pipistrellus kuhlii]
MVRPEQAHFLPACGRSSSYQPLPKAAGSEVRNTGVSGEAGAGVSSCRVRAEVLAGSRGRLCKNPAQACPGFSLWRLQGIAQKAWSQLAKRQAGEEDRIFSQRKCSCGFETFISQLWLAFPRVLRGERRVSWMSPNKAHQ